MYENMAAAHGAGMGDCAESTEADMKTVAKTTADIVVRCIRSLVCEQFVNSDTGWPQ